MHSFVILFLITIVLTIPQASFACSCAWNASVSELEKREATVLLASPVGGYSQSTFSSNGKTYNYEVPTRFKIWKTHLGKAGEYENIGMSQSSSCETLYPVNQVSVIVAYRRNGHLSTDYCTTHQFHRDQLIDYFEYGKDSISREFCYRQFSSGYNEEVFTGEFRLHNKNCLSHKPSYDARFRSNNKTEKRE